jgi:cell division protein FtsI/penicillin-binding protein 2
MKVITKKIIAREFLFILATIVLFIFLLIIWIVLNQSSREKKYKIEKKIEELTQYEILPYRARILYYVNTDKILPNKIENKENFISELKNEKYASEIFEYIKKHYGDTPISKELFLNQILKDTSSENSLNEIIKLENELVRTNSIFSGNIDDDEVFGLGFTLFSIFFLLRYLIYATKWSIKQLKV